MPGKSSAQVCESAAGGGSEVVLVPANKNAVWTIQTAFSGSANLNHDFPDRLALAEIVDRLRRVV